VRFDVNTLTAIAAEGYEQFVENLQKEIDADIGIRFGTVEKHQFANIAVTAEDGTTAPLGLDKSEAVWEFLEGEGSLDARGKVLDTLRTVLKEDTLRTREAVLESKEFK